MTLTARLIEDGGEAAASDEDFFRTPAYLAAESVTHSIVIEEAETAMPVLVREIPGGGTDAISPYGYPGASRPAATEPPSAAAIDWAPTGLVSAFIRDRIDGPGVLSSPTERGQVFLCDPAEPAAVRKRLREQIRRNLRRGWELEPVPGPEVSGPDFAGFSAAYRETMERTAAAERYFFSDDYLRSALSAPGSWLVCARNAGALGAAAIAVVSDGLIHYFLGGTAETALADSPMKNVFAEMIALSERERLPLHLGGGLEPGDSLERFKSGFANRTARFRTHEVICDAGRYAALAGDVPPGAGFFPAYRAP